MHTLHGPPWIGKRDPSFIFDPIDSSFIVYWSLVPFAVCLMINMITIRVHNHYLILFATCIAINVIHIMFCHPPSRSCSPLSPILVPSHCHQQNFQSFLVEVGAWIRLPPLPFCYNNRPHQPPLHIVLTSKRLTTWGILSSYVCSLLICIFTCTLFQFVVPLFFLSSWSSSFLSLHSPYHNFAWT